MYHLVSHLHTGRDAIIVDSRTAKRHRRKFFRCVGFMGVKIPWKDYFIVVVFVVVNVDVNVDAVGDSFRQESGNNIDPGVWYLFTGCERFPQDTGAIGRKTLEFAVALLRVLKIQFDFPLCCCCCCCCCCCWFFSFSFSSIVSRNTILRKRGGRRCGWRRKHEASPRAINQQHAHHARQGDETRFRKGIEDE